MKIRNYLGPKMATHIETALKSFPDDMTKKDLIERCATYIAANPEITITPGWFAQVMMDDGLLLSKRKNMIKGSKAFTWLNVHKLDGKYRGRLIL
jgi:hypothetical protein